MDLSVIIPACNMQGYIAACLRSVIRCPKENIHMECIVIDDGSEDETAAIVKRYIERDSRIKLVTGERSGLADTRNKGIEEARGRYMMFLDAGDRLCEDAWEHIEAAVEEEYADFVAFSHITLYENGKLKARMLPISDVVSTDVQEAKRLMYADSVFDTCWGKIFRSDIIKMGHITFRTSPPVGADFLFVSEYFGNCESYMMTKAMILCRRDKGRSLAQDFRMEERLEFLKVLYEANVSVVERCDDAELKKRMQLHYLDMLANLFGEYAREYRRSRELVESICQNALENELVKKILADVDEHAIPSIRKSYEYRLLKRANVKKIRRYFMCRGAQGRL